MHVLKLICLALKHSLLLSVSDFSWAKSTWRCLRSPNLRFKDLELNQITHLALLVTRLGPTTGHGGNVTQFLAMPSKNDSAQELQFIQVCINPNDFPATSGLSFVCELLVVEEDVTIELFEPWVFLGTPKFRDGCLGG